MDNFDNNSGDRKYSSTMKTGARWMMVAGALFLAGVACFTTYEGLKIVIAAVAAVPTAIGIQSMAFGAETLTAHARSSRERVLALLTYGVAESVSFAFTFLFFFTFVNANVALRQNAIYATSDFRKQQAELHKVAAKVKDSERKELDDQKVDFAAQRKLSSADAETRRRQAERLVEENNALSAQLKSAGAEESETIRRHIQKNRNTIRFCRADASTLKLRAATMAEQEEQIDARRRIAESFTPDVMSVKEGDWIGLKKQYESIATAYGRLTDAGAITLPRMPAPPLYDDKGRILRGQDDRFNEALTRVREPWDAVVWWAFILSAAVEFPGFIALLATRPKGSDLPSRIYSLGNWMRRLGRSIEVAAGVIPFAFKCLFSFLFGKPVRRGHPTVTAYEDLIEALQMRMSSTLKAMTAPITLLTILETRLDSLYANLIHRNYALIAELDEEVTATFDHCVAAIKAEALPVSQEEQIIRLLQEETDRLRMLYRSGDGSGSNNPNQENTHESVKEDAQ